MAAKKTTTPAPGLAPADDLAASLRGLADQAEAQAQALRDRADQLEQAAGSPDPRLVTESLAMIRGAGVPQNGMSGDARRLAMQARRSASILREQAGLAGGELPEGLQQG